MKQKVAIIGSGISGLGLAYLLSSRYDVFIYEKNDYIGGHSRTVHVSTPHGNVPVDTGFIVFNFKTYPYYSGLIRHLGVAIKKSEMQFAVSLDQGRFEYNSSLWTLLSPNKNFFSIPFWKMIFEVLTFLKRSKKYENSYISIEDFLKQMKMSDYFVKNFFLPLVACVWSCPVETVRQFPVCTIIRFVRNHELVAFNSFSWYTIEGGSCEYVKKLIQPFQDRIRLQCAVRQVQRSEKEVRVIDENGGVESFDKVVFASHPDQSLKLLEKSTKDEEVVLSAIRYQKNIVYLHSDLTFMPRRKRIWGAWNYLENRRERLESQLCVSYWMNYLQKLSGSTQFIVTLNPKKPPLESLTYDQHVFEHPILDLKAVEAQKKVSSIQGCLNTWYVGVWQRYGFHEDGLWSAIRVAQQMGVSVPWSY